jgi:hypothetical protein
MPSVRDESPSPAVRSPRVAIDQRGRQQQGDQCPAGEQSYEHAAEAQVVPEVGTRPVDTSQVDPGKEQADRQFDERIPRGNRLPAMTTPALEEQPADHRQVVTGEDRRPAPGTSRWRSDQAHTQG